MNDATHETNDKGIVLGYETSDVDTRGLLMFAAVLFATVLLAGAFVWWLLARFSNDATLAEPPLSPFAHDRSYPTGPHLQSTPGQDLREFRMQEDAQLNSAAWIDRQQHLARIPIEQAIEMVAKDGLPSWPAAPKEQPTENAEEQP